MTFEDERFVIPRWTLAIYHRFILENPGEGDHVIIETPNGLIKLKTVGGVTKLVFETPSKNYTFDELVVKDVLAWNQIAISFKNTKIIGYLNNKQ